MALLIRRISTYDNRGSTLNTISTLNPVFFEEVAANDDRRASSQPFHPLEGIPYNIEDKYKVVGMSVKAGLFWVAAHVQQWVDGVDPE